MTVKLVFSRSPSIYSRIVRVATWSDYSHVDVAMPDGTFIGAEIGRGVTRFGQDALLRNCTHLNYVEAKGVNEAAVYEFLLQQIGKPYDITAIFGMVMRRDWQEDDSWFCSELASAALLAGGLSVMRKRANRITPQNLFESPSLEVA